MDIDKYPFKKFMEIAASFHGYPAPGLLFGGYKVALAKRELPEDTLFDAIVESDKCLPDAVQLLTQSRRVLGLKLDEPLAEVKFFKCHQSFFNITY